MRILLGLFVLLLVVVGLVYGLAGTPWAFEQALGFARRSGVDVRAASLSGNLLSGLRGRDVKLVLPGLDVRAKEVSVGYDFFALLRGELPLRVALADVDLSLDPAKLKGGEATPSSLRVRLEQLSLSGAKLRLAGESVQLPNVDVRVLSVQSNRLIDSLDLRSRLEVKTIDGAANVDAQLHLLDGLQDFSLSLGIDADARIARHWWNGVQSGRIRASYKFSPRSFSGHGRIENAVLEPVAGFRLTNVHGPVSHSVDGIIRPELQAEVFGGPIKVIGKIDTHRSLWQARGFLEPDLHSLLGTLAPGVEAAGRAKITVQGEGWGQFVLTGALRGQGSVAGVSLPNFVGRYCFGLAGNGVPRLELGMDARAGLLERSFAVNAHLSLIEGALGLSAQARGSLLDQPLELALQARSRASELPFSLRLQAKALGGEAALAGSFTGTNLALDGRFGDVRLPAPLGGSLSGRLKLAGPPERLRVMANVDDARLNVPFAPNIDWHGVAELELNPQEAPRLIASLGPLRVDGTLETGRVQLVGAPLELASLGLETKTRASLVARYDLPRSSLAGTLSLGGPLQIGPVGLSSLAGAFDASWARGLLLNWRPRSVSTDPSVTAPIGEAQLHLQIHPDEKIFQATFKNLPLQLSGESMRLAGRFDFDLGQQALTGRGSLTHVAGLLGRDVLNTDVLNIEARGKTVLLNAQLARDEFSLAANGVIGLDNLLAGRVQLEAALSLKRGKSVLAAGNVRLRAGDVPLSIDAQLNEGLLFRGSVQGTAQLQLSLVGPIVRANGSFDVAVLRTVLQDVFVSDTALRDTLRNLPALEGLLELKASVPLPSLASTRELFADLVAQATVKGAVGEVPLGADFLLDGERLRITARGAGQFAGALLKAQLRPFEVDPTLQASLSWSGLNLAAQGLMSDLALRLTGDSVSLISTLKRLGLEIPLIWAAEVGAGVNLQGHYRSGRLELQGELAALRLRGVWDGQTLEADATGGIAFRWDGLDWSVVGLRAKLRASEFASSGHFGFEFGADRLEVHGLESSPFAAGIQATGIQVAGIQAAGTLVRGDLNAHLEAERAALNLADGKFDGQTLRADILGNLQVGEGSRANLRVRYQAAELQSSLSEFTALARAVSGEFVSQDARLTLKTDELLGEWRAQGVQKSVQKGVQKGGQEGGQPSEPSTPWRENFGGRVSLDVSLDDLPSSDVKAQLIGKDWALSASGLFKALELQGQAPLRLLAGLSIDTEFGLPKLALPSSIVRFQGSLDPFGKKGSLDLSASLGPYALAVSTDLDENKLEARLRATLSGRTCLVAFAHLDVREPLESLQTQLELNALELEPVFGVDVVLSGGLAVRAKRIEGELEGEMAAIPFSASWHDGGFHGRLDAALPIEVSTPNWDWPLPKEPLRLSARSSDLPVQASATFDLSSLIGEGEVKLGALEMAAPWGEHPAWLSLGPLTARARIDLRSGLDFRLTDDRAQTLRLQGEVLEGRISVPYRLDGAQGLLELQASGTLSNPSLRAVTSGPVQALGELSGDHWRLQAELGLAPVVDLLPEDLRVRTEPGRLSLHVAGQLSEPLEALRAEFSIKNARVEGETASIDGSLTINHDEPRLSLDLHLGDSRARLDLSSSGIRARDLELDLRLLRLLGLQASGFVRGDLDVSGRLDWAHLDRLNETDWLAGQAQLSFEHVSIEGVVLSGSVQLAERELSATLDGRLPLVLNGKDRDIHWNVSGPLYPRLQASVVFDEARGQLEGLLDLSAPDVPIKDLRLSLEGQVLDLPVAVMLRWADRFELTARLSSAELRARGERGVLPLRGRLEVTDMAALQRALKPWLDTDLELSGRLAGDLIYDGHNLRAEAIDGRVTAQGWPLELHGSLGWDGEHLSTDSLHAVVEREGTRAELSARGQLLPELGASADVVASGAGLSVRAALRASGSVSAPQLSLNGTIDWPRDGLQLGDTIALEPGRMGLLEARFEEGHWQAELLGERIALVLAGTTDGLTSAKLRSSVPVRVADARWQTQGELTWQQGLGFAGSLAAKGSLADLPLELELRGRGDLEGTLETRLQVPSDGLMPSEKSVPLRLELSLDRSPFEAFLHGEADVLERPLRGALHLKTEGLGALLPQAISRQLELGLNGRIGGVLRRPELEIAGELIDVLDDFSAQVKANLLWQGEHPSLVIDARGEHLTLSGTVDAAGMRLGGVINEIRSPLALPGVQELHLSGVIDARWPFAKMQGQDADSISPSLSLRQLRVEGMLEPIEPYKGGRFVATGEASLEHDLLQTRLESSFLGGLLRLGARVQLAQSTLEVELNGDALQFEALGISSLHGQVDLKATITGPLARPELDARLVSRVLIPQTTLATFLPTDLKISGQPEPGAVSREPALKDVTVDLRAHLHGPLDAPRAEIQGQFAGLVLGRATLSVDDLTKAFTSWHVRSDLEIAPGALAQGFASLDGARLKADVSGDWPRLQGGLSASLPALPPMLREWSLSALGDGSAVLRAGPLVGELRFAGSLEQPRLSVTAVLHSGLAVLLAEFLPQETVKSLEPSGDLALRVNADTESGAVVFAGALSQAQIAGVELAEATIKGTLNAAGLIAKANFADGGVLSLVENRLEGHALRFQRDVWRLEGMEFEGTLGAEPALAARASLQGPVSAEVHARLLGALLSFELQDAPLPGGLRAAAHVTSDLSLPEPVLTGTAELFGLPEESPFESPESLPNPVPQENPKGFTFEIKGPLAAPIVSGRGVVAGAQVELAGSLSPLEAKLSLADGPTARAGGSIEFAAPEGREASLSGTLRYASGVAEARMRLEGTPEDVRASLEAKVGRVPFAADVRFARGELRGTLKSSLVGSGGALVLENGRLKGRMEFNLSAFEIGLDGQALLETDIGLDGLGQLKATWTALRAPVELPFVGWKLDGAGSARYLRTLQDEQLEFRHEGAVGMFEGNLKRAWVSPSSAATSQNPASENSTSQSATVAKTSASASVNTLEFTPAWRGAFDIRLGEPGASTKTIDGHLVLDEQGLNGSLAVRKLRLALGALGVGEISIDGSLEFKGDRFALLGGASLFGGRLRLEGSGQLGDVLERLLPGTASVLGVPVQNEGFGASVRLDAVRLEDVGPLHAFVPGLRGRISGVAVFSELGSEIQITAPQLHLGDEPLALRVSVAASGEQFAYSGSLGQSTFSGRSDGERISGQLDLRRAPLHAALGAFFGAVPGTAYVTGLARYDLSMARFRDSSIRVAIERADISGGGEQLRGGGALRFVRGALEIDDLHAESLSGRGAGAWRAQGRYAPDGVDLSVVLTNTSLTPMLELVPQLRELHPTARGDLKLTLTGRYELPTAQLEVGDLALGLAGFEVHLSQLVARLAEGTLSLGGTLTGGGNLGGTLALDGRAQVASFAPLRVEDLAVHATGNLAVEPLGRIDDVRLELTSPKQGALHLSLLGRKGGALRLEGDLMPVLDLRLFGDDIALSLPQIFIHDAVVAVTSDAPLRLRAVGQELVVTGGVNLSRATLTLNTAESEPKAKVSGSSDGAPAGAASSTTVPRASAGALGRIRFDRVEIAAPANVRLQESFADVEFGGKILLTGTLLEPVLSGSLSALSRASDGERGEIALGPHRFSLNQAQAVFNPADGVLPTLTALGKTRIVASLGLASGVSAPNGVRTASAAIQVTLEVSVHFERDARGQIGPKLETKVSGTVVDGFGRPISDFAPLTDQMIYGLLVFGSADLASLGQGVLNTALNYFVLGEFARAFKSSTGIDLRVDTNLFNLPEEDRRLGATFTFGGYLLRQLYLEYQVDTSGVQRINLNYTTDDGRFSIRVSSPFRIDLTPGASLLRGFAPELAVLYNFSTSTSLSVGLTFSTSTTLKLGLSFRF